MKENYKLELISFKLCPFVQRSVITLLRKGVDFDLTFIDLANKPDWFLKISPMGKVPILKVNENDIIFESAVINEFVDEITSPSYMAAKPLQRAKERAWIEYASQLNSDFFKLSCATDKESSDKLEEELFKKIGRLEPILKGNRGYFRGEDFSLVDSSYAPLFMRMSLIERLKNNKKWDKLARVKVWSNNLLDDDAVKRSVVDNFKELFYESLEKRDSYIIK